MATYTNLEYFKQRAQSERAQAAASMNPAVAACHLELARRYDLLIRQEDAEEKLATAIAA